MAEQDRLTVVVDVYHEKFGTPSPTQSHHGFDYKLGASEQPYYRQARIGQERKQIDAGWLATNAGYVKFVNRSKTESIRLAFDEFAEHGILVRPRHCCLFEVEDIGSLYVQAVGGEALVDICLFPK